MGVHFDEGESAVSLESRFDDEAKVLEQRNDIVGGGVWGQVANVDSGLPARSLRYNNIVAADAVSRELMVAEGSRGSHAHCLHSLLLSNRWLSLLVRPVAADGTRAQPFSVHGAESLLGFGTVAESNEAVTTGATSFHVPHDTGLGDRAKGRKCLSERLIVNLVGQVTNKDVEVTGCVLLAGCVGLVGPVDTNFLPKLDSYG